MSQVYHNNAKTNAHTRLQIQQSLLSNSVLASKYEVNVKTIIKHRRRGFTEDKSSRPNKITYSLSPLDKEIIRVVRTLTWLGLDDLVDTLAKVIPNSNRSNIYRTLVDFDINTVPKDKRDEAKKFKEYKPGFIHVDVTYLPKLNGKK